MKLENPVQTVHNQAGRSIPTVVEKRWGRELTYWNNSYCMKRLEINPQCRGSMHFHVHKHETLQVVQGNLTIEYNDGKGGSDYVVLHPGDAYVIPPGFQHRLCAGTELVVLIEASTYDDVEDSIRVAL